VGEQRAIAHILGALDDKIELNRQMSETLEAMAQALFRSWFVDFDPVRAKIDGQHTELPSHTADLFPASFRASELGDIPEGWQVSCLGDQVEATRGFSYKGSGLADAGVPMHNLNSIYEGGGYKYEGIKYYTGDYQSHHRIGPGDLIVANTEQGHGRLLIGYAAIVPSRFGEETIFSHHLYRVQPKGTSHLSAEYLCYLLNSREVHDTVSGFANGTTVNMLPVDALQMPLVVIPPIPVVEAFTEFAGAARKRCEHMVEESQTLAALRDTLLPKLISGELRVPEAEQVLEAAL
jgi:type I restriction enzyme S subunit